MIQQRKPNTYNTYHGWMNAGELHEPKVYEDEFSVAILDVYPVAPGHILVMPKLHFAELADLDETTASEVIKKPVKIHMPSTR